MGKDKPVWKNLINRDYIKDVLRTAFKRIAKGNKEEEIGRATNDLERYLVSELLMNTREVMDGIKEQLDDAMKFLENLAGGIDEDVIKRRAQMMEEADENKK